MPVAGDFRVGEWQVHPSLNRLVRGDSTVQIPSRFMDLLVFLAEHRGNVVSKDEIIGAVWQKEFVSEGTLTHAIAALRQALGDGPREPTYIETIPTRGYRLIAEVTASLASPAPGERRPPRPGPFRWMVLGAVVVAAAGVAAGVRLSRSRSGAPRAATESHRLAVLPFANLGTPDRDYLAVGLTDDLTTRLAGVPGLGVISRVSAESCAKTGKSAPQIAAELGVSFLLTGSVRWEPDPGRGGQVVVNAQLVRAADDTHVWAEAYRRPVGSVFEIETEIASRVLQDLGVTMQDAERARLSQRPTSDGAAYEAYLCGLRHLDFETREHLGLAAAMFERAVELDPRFALAYAALGLTHARFYQLHFDARPERLVLAKADIDHALALRPDLPQGAMALGAYYLYGLKDPERALEAFHRAASGLPNDSELVALMVDVYRREGRWQDALAASRKLVAVDPRNYVAAMTLGETLSWLRHYEEADRVLQQAESLVPDSISPYVERFRNALLWEGAGGLAERVLADLPAPEGNTALLDRFLLRFMRRDFKAARDVLAGARSEAFGGSTLVGPPALLECLAVHELGDRAGVARSCGQAMDVLRREGAMTSRDPRLQLAAGYAAALLGERREALAAVERATTLCPFAADAFEGAAVLAEAARVWALTGAADRAVTALDQLLDVPAPVSVAVLRTDPRFDAVRDDAGFVALMADHSRPSP